MIKFEKIKPGMNLFDVRKNTGLGHNKWNTWRVSVIDVDTENRMVLASWNNNPAEWISEGRITKFRAKIPVGSK